MSKKQKKKDHCVTSTHLLVLRQLKSCRLLLFLPPLPPPPPPFLVNKKNLIIRGNIQCRTAVCLARLDYFTFSLSTIVGSSVGSADHSTHTELCAGPTHF